MLSGPEGQEDVIKQDCGGVEHSTDQVSGTRR